MIKRRLLFLGLTSIMLMACKKEGCTDASADNYNKKAKKDDGSCVYGSNSNGSNQNLPINLTGTENSDITITNQSNDPNVADYYIDGEWEIKADVTIEPGVRIMMKSDASIKVLQDGSMNATGTPTQRIQIFGENDEHGYWKTLSFSSGSSNNKLIHCVIKNGGESGLEEGMVSLTTIGKVKIQNSVFKKASRYGISSDWDSNSLNLTDFKNNTIDDCQKAPVLVKIGQVEALDNTTDYGSNNGKNAVYIKGQAFTDISVNNIDYPYYLVGHITVTEENTTIQPGVKLIMGPNKEIRVTDTGSLTFAGTSTNHCIVTGEEHSKGWWESIHIENNQPQNVFSYTDFSDGGEGYFGPKPAIVIEQNAQLTMDNCSITNCADKAVDGDGTFIDNQGNSWLDCEGGGGLLP